MACPRLAAVWLAPVLCALLAGGALADVARASADRGIQVLGPPTETVRFVAGDARVRIVVRNASARSGRVKLTFVSRSGDRFGVRAARADSAGRPVTVDDPRDLLRPLAPGASRQVELALHLGPDQAPADGGGAIVAQLPSGGSTTAKVAIRGTPPDIAFDPPKLTIDVSQACWMIGRACGATATVLLRGRDAVRWARSAHAQRGVAILHNDQGGTVTIRLDDIDVRAGAVRATVRANDFGEAGRYSARLPLEASGLSGPQIAVDVKVRWSLAAAVLTIFAGALFGGFFLRRFEIRRRRTLLELELLSALARYDEQRARSDGKPASYDLDHLLEPRRHDRAATIPYPGTRGVSALLWHIKHARDDEDFSEDIERTHALIGAIERWLALEPVARETAELLDGDAPARSGTALADTMAYRDLGYLRVRASTPPTDDEDCEALIGALATQGRVAARCKVVWELLADLESRQGILYDQARTLASLDVTAIESGYPSFHKRAPAQTDQLLAELDQAEDRLRRLRADIGGPEKCAGVTRARRIEDRLDASARNPAIERSMPDIGPWRLRLAGSFNALAMRSVVWTLARALVASVAYALVIYSDTWGTVTDFASAFTTGFLTETVVNWAVLPAFRTNRSRRRTACQPEEMPADGGQRAPGEHPPRLEPVADPGRAPQPPRLQRGER